MKSRWQHGGNVYEVQRNTGVDHRKVIDFSANINPLGFPQGLTEAIVGGLTDLVHYPDPDYNDLSESIAAAKNIPARWVYPGNGAIELIYMIMEYLKPSRAHVIAPGFVEYERSLRRYGAEVDWICLKEEEDFRLTEGTIAPALGNPGEPIVLCTPNNPTGALIEPELLVKIMKRAHEANQPLIIDEAFMDFVDPKVAMECIPCAEKYPNLFVLRSMTKCYAVPGLRLGYLVTSSEGFSEWVQEYRIPWMVNHLASLAGQAALNDTKHIESTRRYISEQRERLIQGLCRIEGIKVYPAEANFVCIRLLGAKLDLKAELLKRGILIRSCANYIGMDPSFYRIAVRKEEDCIALLEAFEEIFG